MELVFLWINVAILVASAATFSGLNISLMALSVSDLQRRAKLGDQRARRVLPLRKNAHLSLASILFANVAVVSMSTLLLESRFNGWVAGIVTTLLMVVFGEVLPQAIFVKSALLVCSRLAPLIRFVTFVTYPLSKPLAILLDKTVGPERHRLHTRRELGLIINEHKIGNGSELDEDEVEIIENALQLSEKQVKDIMLPIKQVFWLTLDDILDEKTVAEIKMKGYSRVPIFDKKLTECHGVILMKDMVGIDFGLQPMRVADFTRYQTKMVGSRTALDTMMHRFPSIHSHLIPVEQNDKIVGIVTIEDLVEEIIGQEIVDETDRIKRHR